MSEPRAETDLGAALERLPLFPLPQVTLFPGAMLPLHVFEPRYKAMIRDCLSSHRALGVVQITDVGRLDEHGHPRIARVAGAGVIVDHVSLPEGRYNILVQGRERVALDELPFVAPYRTARASVLTPPGDVIPERDLTALLSNAAAFLALVRDHSHDFDVHLPTDAPPGAVADLCAHHLVLDATERQSLLELLGVAERISRVTQILALQRLALARRGRDHSAN